MKKIYLKIDGMHCSHCEETIKTCLLDFKNIKKVTFDGKIACIDYENNLNQEEIIHSILNQGYITKKEYFNENKQSLKDHMALTEFLLIFLSIILINILLYYIFGFNIFNMIPTIDSNITYGMLFLTGILTSVHCVSMCGAINLLASYPSNQNLKRPILYNIGRVLSYSMIGGIVGMLGSIIAINEQISGIIMILVSIVMLLMSFNMLGILNLKKFQLFHNKPQSKNPFIIGILNGFMPCGPLQAMQIYALQTGSFIKGFISMFLFGLGTVPLMLTAGIILNVVKGKTKIMINKIASVLILLLSIMMLNRGLLTLNIDISKPLYNNYSKTTIEENIQTVTINLNYDQYQNIIVQKDIPVRLIIHVEKDKLTGCNNEIVIREFNIQKKLQEGDNIIEFTPTKTETFSYTCWMNMIKNTIKVIDNENYFKEG